MTIPKVDVPIYELTIPSTGKEVRVRPFIVKEEKLLLMAAETNDSDEIIKTTKQVITNCLIDDDIKVDNLPFFDVDYLFIALRAKSIGETVEMRFTCNNEVDGHRCGTVFDTNLDIAKAVIDKNDSIPNVCDLGSGVTVKMKYPNYSLMKSINDNMNVIDKKVLIIANCIDQIVRKDKVYTAKDFSKQELTEFVEGLTKENYDKLEMFIDNFPGFVVRLEETCPGCGFTHRMNYRDFTSFFR